MPACRIYHVSHRTHEPEAVRAQLPSALGGLVVGEVVRGEGVVWG